MHQKIKSDCLDCILKQCIEKNINDTRNVLMHLRMDYISGTDLKACIKTLENVLERSELLKDE